MIRFFIVLCICMTTLSVSAQPRGGRDADLAAKTTDRVPIFLDGGTGPQTGAIPVATFPRRARLLTEPNETGRFSIVHEGRTVWLRRRDVDILSSAAKFDIKCDKAGGAGTAVVQRAQQGTSSTGGRGLGLGGDCP